MPRDPGLVTLSEGAKILGLNPVTVRVAWHRRRHGESPTPFPDPVVEGRTVRLWSVLDLEAWAQGTGRVL